MTYLEAKAMASVHTTVDIFEKVYGYRPSQETIDEQIKEQTALMRSMSSMLEGLPR